MDTRETVLHRIALAEQRDARTHGTHFEDSLAAFSVLFGEEIAEEARRAVPALTEAGAFNCPVSQLLRLCDVGADATSRLRGVAYSEVLNQIGDFCGRAYLQSSLGRALWRLPRMEPHDALASSLASARASTNYGQRRYERLGDSSGRLIMQHEFMGPAWIHGFYAHGLLKLTARPLLIQVEVCVEPGLDFNLRVSW